MTKTVLRSKNRKQASNPKHKMVPFGDNLGRTVGHFRLINLICGILIFVFLNKKIIKSYFKGTTLGYDRALETTFVSPIFCLFWIVL